MNIGAAARKSGVSPKMIRYYERVGLLPQAARSEGNYRTYDELLVRRLLFIHRARDLGFPLAAIRQLLLLWEDRGRSSRDVKRIALETVGQLRGKLQELQSIIGALEHLASHCHGDERPECPILDDLGGLGQQVSEAASSGRSAPARAGADRLRYTKFPAGA